MELRAMSVNLGLIYSRWSVKKEGSRMRYTCLALKVSRKFFGKRSNQSFIQGTLLASELHFIDLLYKSIMKEDVKEEKKKKV